MREEFEYIISKQMDSRKREVITIPSSQEQNINSGLHCIVEMDEICRYMGFLIIIDSKKQIRMQKLLGYGEQVISITKSSETTSIGGVPGEIYAGEWEIIFGIFTEYLEQKLGEQTATIRITITDEPTECTEAIGKWCFVDGMHGLQIAEENYSYDKCIQTESKWYKGDFHTHTTLSDGKDTVRHAMEKAVKQGLDFYVPTEHNVMHTGWCDTKLLILPGIEITTVVGHFNIFGIKDQPIALATLLLSSDNEIIQECCIQIMKEARQQGAIISINHPFLHIWKWLGGEIPLTLIDCMEIINDPTYDYAKESNDKAIAFLDFLWQDGHKIFGVGGSDAHNLTEERYTGATEPSIIGDPATYVYCDTLTPRKLLNHVKQGNVLVTRYIEIIPEIIVGEQSYLPGSEIMSSEDIRYHIVIKQCEQLPIVYVVCNGKKTELTVRQSEDGTYYANASISYEGQEWQWIRMEVRSKEGAFLAYSNPVYRGKMESRFITYKDALSAMEEVDAN
ncbi:CehA/McbA family metallohydrolase [Anaerosporobacter sp.]|uniref:CehA/McbA family metallohydrolase n=1 Tax=Anaerosporobacter sp. TaxID=1872529 RepID=UPI00286F8B9A|nr:CehA/McbA family metallohydrolase [Anaerosporobacter sp.]